MKPKNLLYISKRKTKVNISIVSALSGVENRTLSMIHCFWIIEFLHLHFTPIHIFNGKYQIILYTCTFTPALYTCTLHLIQQYLKLNKKPCFAHKKVGSNGSLHLHFNTCTFTPALYTCTLNLSQQYLKLNKKARFAHQKVGSTGLLHLHFYTCTFTPALYTCTLNLSQQYLKQFSLSLVITKAIGMPLHYCNTKLQLQFSLSLVIQKLLSCHYIIVTLNSNYSLVYLLLYKSYWYAITLL